MRFALFWPRTKVGESAKMYGLSRVSPIPGSFMRDMFPINRRFSDEAQDDTLGFIVIPNSLEQKLLSWAKTRSGFPGDGEGQFWRLLYLSAITITTVGYGDILPISTRARLSVATEAVIGVVMIGLFLNSLAEKARRPVQAGGHSDV